MGYRQIILFLALTATVVAAMTGGPMAAMLVITLSALLTHALREPLDHLLEQRAERCAAKLRDAEEALVRETAQRVAAEKQVLDLTGLPEENHNPVLKVDAVGKVLFANHASAPFFEAWGIGRDDPLPELWVDALNDILECQNVGELELTCGKRVYSVRMVPTANRQHLNLYGLDITERVEAERSMFSLARFPAEDSNPILRAGRDGKLLYANNASRPLLEAWGVNCVRAGQVFDCQSCATDPRCNSYLPDSWTELVQDALKSGDDKETEIAHEGCVFSIRIAPVMEPGYANLYGRDITNRKAYEAELARYATQDSLTGLANRSLFQDRLRHALHMAGDAMTAIIMIGLKNFPQINEALGHEGSDALLRGFSQNLLKAKPEGATVARYGGDAFAVILEHLSATSQAADSADLIRRALDTPIKVQGRAVEVEHAMGIALHPLDGDDDAELIRRADIAMFRAKADKPEEGYCFYEQGMNETLQERYALLEALRGAVKRGEIELHYQPQICIETQRVTGMEALVRWRFDGELVSPGRFIPLAEESGLIIPIGQHVLEQACRDAVRWRKGGLGDLQMAVNLSSVQFGQADLPRQVRRAVEEAGLPPEALELEITESVAADDIETTIATMQTLSEAGYRLSIDDFGAGYSSLSYLKRFPVHKLKIDQSFVRDVTEDPGSIAICRTIIQLGRGLGLKVIAEGVESEKELAWVCKEGCHMVQGYHYSRPLPADELADFVRGWSG